MINFNWIECFLTLAETLSFTKTGKALNISQPNVSRQIFLLEEQLKTQLFIRDRNKVALSEAGHRLRKEIAPLTKDISHILSAFSIASEALTGQLSFGSLTEIGQSTFMSMLLDFQKKNPDIHLSIQFTTETEIKHLLKTGTLDFGIVTSLENSELLRCYPLLQERIVLLTRVQNIQKLETEANPRFILYRSEDAISGHYQRAFFKKLKLKEILPYVVVNSHRSMIDALLSSNTYAVMPYSSIGHLIREKKLKIASPLELKNELYLAHVDNPHLDRKCKEFKNHFLASCRPEKIKN